MSSRSNPSPGSEPTFVELYTPKLVTVLREGYRLSHLRADALAGLTVAIVALPLSMAIAIASGATPAQGLITAIIGGFIVSALGGSRFQIGGPAGAFIVLVAATVHTHGMDGMLLATLLAGLMLAAIGLLRLGTYIKFIPYPVTVGFTSGIAVIIFASQIKDLLGLTLSGPEPGPMADKLPAFWHVLPTMSLAALGVSVATILVIAMLKRFRPQWPGMLIAVAAAATATWLWHLPIETIGSRFGGIAASMPMPRMPQWDLAKVVVVLPSAVAFALLGAIESLLSAVVADGMTGRRHRSNCELLAQGIGNVASAFFGGVPVTGTIARTATNVRAGAHGPVSGMLHAIFLLLFVLVAAPLAAFIPLACLAGVLVVVAWNMIEKQAFATLLRASRGDALVLLATLGLTVFRDLTEAIIVGSVLGMLLFIQRMSETTAIETHSPFVAEDQADDAGAARAPYHSEVTDNSGVLVYRISGAFFFGAAASIGSVLERIGDQHRSLIVDFSAVPFVDSTAAHTISGLVQRAARRGVAIVLSGASPGVQRELAAYGLDAPVVQMADSIETARASLAATHG
ncbi:MAG TPA: SulP family inorganic anion transporter [Steroidobacteraceae bacterium]|nr:SulP family inorganic anion transporter [Steroidobacteraceae bacterium]HRX88534.1 SulP family inorganic anion transporter [Steroidobacteraceae bacterium]